MGEKCKCFRSRDRFDPVGCRFVLIVELASRAADSSVFCLWLARFARSTGRLLLGARALFCRLNFALDEFPQVAPSRLSRAAAFFARLRAGETNLIRAVRAARRFGRAQLLARSQWTAQADACCV